MLGIIRRYYRRRELAAAVTLVPFQLMRDYGPKETYTAGQVKGVLSRSNAKGDVARCALAANCTQAEFIATGATAIQYRALREELIALFHIGSSNFTCRHLLARLKGRPSTWGDNTGTGMAGSESGWGSDGGGSGGGEGTH